MKNNGLLLLLVLVFVSCSPKQFLLLEDGESLTALTRITDGERPSLSPYGGENGKNLFFSVFEEYGYCNIYVKQNVTATAVNKKTNGKNVNIQPCYNAKTDRFAFHTRSNGMTHSDIYTMANKSEAGLRQVTDTPGYDESNPCFSKDGNFIVYDKHPLSYVTLGDILCSWSSYIQAFNSEIWLKNLRNGETTLLGSGYQPQFSPDGKRIAFVKYSGDVKSCDIWLMDIDGQNVTKLTNNKNSYAFYPRWSTDGSKIVFQLTKKEKKDADIYIIDANGNNLTQLTINKSYDGMPYWTEDNYLYFVSDRGQKHGNYQIWRMKMNGSISSKSSYSESNAETEHESSASKDITNRLKRVNKSNY